MEPENSPAKSRKLLQHGAHLDDISLNSQGATLLFNDAHPLFSKPEQGSPNLENSTIQTLYNDRKLRFPSQKGFESNTTGKVPPLRPAHRQALQENKQRLRELGILTGETKDRPLINRVSYIDKKTGRRIYSYHLIGVRLTPVKVR